MCQVQAGGGLKLAESVESLKMMSPWIPVNTFFKQNDTKKFSVQLR